MSQTPCVYSTDINVVVTCAPPIDNLIRQAFYFVLADYCGRFNTTIKNKYDVHITLVEPLSKTADTDGLTTTTDSRILVQVRDPYLEDGIERHFTADHYLQETLFHELVHACQSLTNRAGIRIKAKYDRKDPFDKYHFDPAEVEARIMQTYYAQKYGKLLLADNLTVKVNGKTIRHRD